MWVSGPSTLLATIIFAAIFLATLILIRLYFDIRLLKLQQDQLINSSQSAN